VSGDDVVEQILRQWERERPDLDASPIAVFGRLTRVYQLKQARLRTLLARFDLTPATFDVLANLRRSGAGAPRTAGEIAQSSLLSTGGTTFRLDRLEDRDLIRRNPSEQDRRVTHVELTADGRALIDEVMTAHLTQEAELLTGLDPAEVAQLGDLLSRLETSVSSAGEPSD
jgi:DNA-binding MarR family transcriptional regulator